MRSWESPGRSGAWLPAPCSRQNNRSAPIVRDAAKGRAWSERGCEVALATIEDAASLTAAFRGAESVFALVPPNFDPLPEFPEAQAIGKTLRAALAEADPARVVYLSTIGAQASQAELAYPTYDHRERARRIAGPGNFPAPGLVYGELQLGCSSGEGSRV